MSGAIVGFGAVNFINNKFVTLMFNNEPCIAAGRNKFPTKLNLGSIYAFEAYKPSKSNKYFANAGANIKYHAATVTLIEKRKTFFGCGIISRVAADGRCCTIACLTSNGIEQVFANRNVVRPKAHANSLFRVNARVDVRALSQNEQNGSRWKAWLVTPAEDDDPATRQGGDSGPVNEEPVVCLPAPNVHDLTEFPCLHPNHYPVGTDLNNERWLAAMRRQMAERNGSRRVLQDLAHFPVYCRDPAHFRSRVRDLLHECPVEMPWQQQPQTTHSQEDASTSTLVSDPIRG